MGQREFTVSHFLTCTEASRLSVAPPADTAADACAAAAAAATDPPTEEAIETDTVVTTEAMTWQCGAAKE